MYLRLSIYLLLIGLAVANVVVMTAYAKCLLGPTPFWLFNALILASALGALLMPVCWIMARTRGCNLFDLCVLELHWFALIGLNLWFLSKFIEVV
jgi:hypothetical protein